MNKNGLIYGMSFLFLISFVLLGLIVINEKKVEIIIPKVEEKMNTYLKENYENIEKEIKKGKITYEKENKRFVQKLTNIKNKNLYFYLYYKKKTITSTYKEDYDLGKTLLTHLEKKLEKEINDETIKVKIKTPLNKMTLDVKELLLKEENLKTLKVYTIEKELKIDIFTAPYIVQAINNLLIENNTKQISTKDYTLTITNSKDITQSVKIESLILPNNNINEIITGILLNDKSTETKYNIKYEFLN